MNFRLVCQRFDTSAVAHCFTAVILNLIGQFQLRLQKGSLNGNLIPFTFVVSSTVEKMDSAGAPAKHESMQNLT